MAIVKFFFKEGSPVIFSLIIVIFSLEYLTSNYVPFMAVLANFAGMFAVTMICLGYMIIQMGLTAFAKIGKDAPLMDLFLSMLPLITLVIIAVLSMVGQVQLTMFQILGLGIAAVVVVMDIIFNTLVMFKMNRLANDFVQMQ